MFKKGQEAAAPKPRWDPQPPGVEHDDPAGALFGRRKLFENRWNMGFGD